VEAVEEAAAEVPLGVAWERAWEAAAALQSALPFLVAPRSAPVSQLHSRWKWLSV
jgi:hypothetical protein